MGCRSKISIPFFANKKINFLSHGNMVFLVIIIGLMIVMSPSFMKLKWIGLSLAMFSTMANDSIQTLGTFLNSNVKTSWWKLWIYISVLFIGVVYFGWLQFDYSLDFGRLENISYDSGFDLMHLIAPLLLIFLTYNKIPASTTFMILSVFSSQYMVKYMLLKTFFGYLFAFTFSYFLWGFLLKYFQHFLNYKDKKYLNRKWIFFQWLSTGLLWTSWLTQNTVNIVVYLPRTFDVYDLILFMFLGVLMIGFIFYNKGGPIQEIVDKKRNISNACSCTIVNLGFAFVILSMSLFNTIPMATTWVFIGILAGRELSIARYEMKNILDSKDLYIKAGNNIKADLVAALLGIIISLIFSIMNSDFYAN